MFYYKYLMHRLCTNIQFNHTFIANTNPYAWWNVSRISGKMYQTSARFDVILLITWILTDTRRSKNIQKNVNFVGKSRNQQRLNNKILRKRNVYKWKKVKQPFYRFCMLKTHTHMQISYKPVVQAYHNFKIFMHTSKGREINFKFPFKLKGGSLLFQFPTLKNSHTLWPIPYINV